MYVCFDNFQNIAVLFKLSEERKERLQRFEHDMRAAEEGKGDSSCGAPETAAAFKTAEGQVVLASQVCFRDKTLKLSPKPLNIKPNQVVKASQV